jgi:hypothetical protein
LLRYRSSGSLQEVLVVSRLNPYLSFDGDARQALEFYREVFGGELVLNTFGAFGSPDAPGADKIMHGMLETPSGFTLMGADTPGPASPSASAATTKPNCAATGRSSPPARPSPSPSTNRCGATSSACARTASACRGW